jgi:HK97 family phage major capsid protein
MPTNPEMLAEAENNLATALAERRRITKTVERSGRQTFNDLEEQQFNAVSGLIHQLRERVAQLREDGARRSDLRGAADKIFNSSEGQTANMSSSESRALQHLTQSGTYNIHNQRGANRVSIVADMLATSFPGAGVDGEAAARLAAHKNEMRNAGLELRTGLNTTVGDAGSFAPPAYMISQYAEYARPVAVTTNLIPTYDLESPVVNIPKITLGTSLSTQASQNTALTETDITDEYLTETAITIGAKETVSRQVLDLAYPGLDAILFKDLAAAHATFLDNAILQGGGSPTLTGILQQPSLATIAIPTAGTVVENLYAGLARALAYVATNRYLPATAIVMSPSRWYGLMSETDSSGRPLVVPTGDGNSPFNAAGTAEIGAPSAGLAGHVLGLPVYLDAQLSDTDILVGRWEDAARYTSGLRLQMSFEPLLGQLSALFVAYSYEALFVRYLPSFVLVTDSESVTWGS